MVIEFTNALGSEVSLRRTLQKLKVISPTSKDQWPVSGKKLKSKFTNHRGKTLSFTHLNVTSGLASFTESGPTSKQDLPTDDFPLFLRLTQ